MTRFTIVLEYPIEADSEREAILQFQREALHPLSPSMEVSIFKGDSDARFGIAASEVLAYILPKRQFMWRSKEYETFYDAWKDGAVYPLGMYAPDLTQINASLKVVDECLGTNSGLKVSEW